MKVLIDDADTTKIRRLWEYYPCDGVTTNPSILAKSGRKPYEVLLEIRSIIGVKAELHVQALSRKSDDMVAEVHRIVETLGEATIVKIPATEEGLRAIRQLNAQGISVTATAIYTPMQAFLAGKAGADYAAPYVNRIDNLSGDGVQTAKNIHDLFQVNGLKTQVLAASFKNTRQVLELARHGIGGATVGTAVFEALLDNACVDHAVEAFMTDFEACHGTGKTMLDI